LCSAFAGAFWISFGLFGVLATVRALAKPGSAWRHHGRRRKQTRLCCQVNSQLSQIFCGFCPLGHVRIFLQSGVIMGGAESPIPDGQQMVSLPYVLQFHMLH